MCSLAPKKKNSSTPSLISANTIKQIHKEKHPDCCFQARFTHFQRRRVKDRDQNKHGGLKILEFRNFVFYYS